MRIAGTVSAILVLTGLVTWIVLYDDPGQDEQPLRRDAATAGDASSADPVSANESGAAEDGGREKRREPLLHGVSDALDPSKLCRLVVTITDAESGAPLADEAVEITLQVLETEEIYFPIDVRTNDEGVAVVKRLQARFARLKLEVWIETATHESRPRWSRAHFDPETRTHTATSSVVLSEAIGGRVLLPPGVPASASLVWYRRPGVMVDHYGGIGGERLTIDEEGGFYKTARGFEPVVVEVTIAHEGKRWFGGVAVPEPGTDLEVPVGPLRLGDPALVRFETVGPEGNPVEAYAVLDVHSADGLTEKLDLNSESLEDEGLTMFRYQPDAMLWFEATPGRVPGVGGTRVGPFPAATTDVVVRLEPERVLRGRVLTEEGEPVSGAALRAEPVVEGPFPAWYFTFDDATKTDAKGRFALEELSRRRYVLTVTKDTDYVTERLELSEEQDELDIVLRRSPPVEVRVVDDHGEPVSTAKVIVEEAPYGVVLDPDQLPWAQYAFHGEWRRVAEVATERDGRTVLEGLDPRRRYRLLVWPRNNHPTLSNLEIQGWRPVVQTFTVTRGLMIRGRVVDAAGAPVRGVYVFARGLADEAAGGMRYRRADGTTYVDHPSAWVRKNGRFAVGPLPPGRYAVWTVPGEEFVVEAGAEEVVLRGKRWEETVLALHVSGGAPGDRGLPVLLSDAQGWTRVRRLEAGGYCDFHHSRNDCLHEVWIPGLTGKRYVWKRDLDLPVDDDWRVVELETKQGGTIRGDVLPPEADDFESFWVLPVGPLLERMPDGKVLGGCPCQLDQEARTFELTGVPPGEWTIEVRARSGECVFEVSLEASAGDHITARMR